MQLWFLNVFRCIFGKFRVSDFFFVHFLLAYYQLTVKELLNRNLLLEFGNHGWHALVTPNVRLLNKNLLSFVP